MKPHTRMWFKSRGKKPGELILCELCRGREAGPPHHIDPRRMGGSKLKDAPENLIALCYVCHSEAEGPEKERMRPELLKRVKEILGL